MLELYFNELSLKTQAVNPAHANTMLLALFELCDAVTALKLGTVRLRTQKGIAAQNIFFDNYNLYEFFGTLKQEDRQRYVTYLAQSAHLHDNPYYTLEDEEVIGFGHAYEAEGIAISINNADNWPAISYPIKREYLAEGDDAEIEYLVKNVSHLPNIGQITAYKPYFSEKTLENARLNLANINSISDFWQKREELFPNLYFCPEAEAMLLKFGSVNHPTFIKAASYLEKLNLHLLEVKMKRKKFDAFPGKISPDTKQTLTSYSEEREFTLPSGNKEVFSVHAKLGELRIYLYPDVPNTRIIIGHIGGHLNTSKYKKA